MAERCLGPLLAHLPWPHGTAPHLQSLSLQTHLQKSEKRPVLVPTLLGALVSLTSPALLLLLLSPSEGWAAAASPQAPLWPNPRPGPTPPHSDPGRGRVASNQAHSDPAVSPLPSHRSGAEQPPHAVCG